MYRLKKQIIKYYKYRNKLNYISSSAIQSWNACVKTTNKLNNKQWIQFCEDKFTHE